MPPMGVTVKCLLVILACSITAAEDSFSFSGFPEVATGASRTITCNHPGGRDYVWRSPKGVTSSGYSHSFTATYNDHNGLWQCVVMVNGQKKIGKANLFVYCSGKFVTSASTTNPSLGDSVELKCRVNSPSGSEVQWQLTTPGATSSVAVAAVQEKPNTCVVYEEKNNRKWSTSTTCQTLTSNYNFNLIILKTRKSDVGYWICFDFSDTECYSRPVRISFAKPPRDPPTLKGFTNPIVGTNHTLTCNAWQPFVRLLTYTWFKDGVQISQGNTSTWLLRPVVKGANGKYRCEVEDKIKNLKVKAEDTLVVYYAATWNPAIPRESLTRAELGETVNLTLNVLAYPAPSAVEWFLQTGGSTIVVKATSTKISDGSWVLTIPSIQKEDYGLYIVNVTNAAGIALFKFTIAKKLKPDTPTNLNALATGADSIVITFTAGSNGGAPQTFTIEYNAKDKSPQIVNGVADPIDTKIIMYKIHPLAADTTYYIRVKAVHDGSTPKTQSDYTSLAEAKTSSATPTASVKTGMTAGEVAGTIVSVILAVALLSLIVVAVVVMRRMHMGCFAGQERQQAVLDDATVNPAFQDDVEPQYGNASQFGRDETEPVYVNQPQQATDVAEPDYVNQPKSVRDSGETEVYEDVPNMYERPGRPEPVPEEPYEQLPLSSQM